MAAALVGATLVPGVAMAGEPGPLPDCPPGTMADDTGSADDGQPGPVPDCVCVTDVTIIVVGDDTSGCPAERPPIPPEDCADAPPSCVPGEAEVLGVSVERVPQAVTAVTAVTAAGVAPAFTG